MKPRHPLGAFMLPRGGRGSGWVRPVVVNAETAHASRRAAGGDYRSSYLAASEGTTPECLPDIHLLQSLRQAGKTPADADQCSTQKPPGRGADASPRQICKGRGTSQDAPSTLGGRVVLNCSTARVSAVGVSGWGILIVNCIVNRACGCSGKAQGRTVCPLSGG